MNELKKLSFIYFIIFLEGYIVLSSELLAIRQIIPFVGSGTDTVSIIIAAVLMPLALGYYIGGRYNAEQQDHIRQKLRQNVFIATIFLCLGLSYVTINLFFDFLFSLGVHNRIITTSIYAVLFIILPVFLLAQTIPLVSSYFSKEKISEATGKMLFFSTIGSFMGAVFTTLLLMAYIGVHHTTSIVIGSLTLLFVLLSHDKYGFKEFFMLGIFVIALVLNSDRIMQSLNIVENNKYNTIRVLPKNEGHTRILSLNNNLSSIYTDKDAVIKNPDSKTGFNYIDFINNHILPELELNDVTNEILIIGAGGFAIGLYDDYNNYTYIDIDDSLKEISEKYLLKQELGENKKFIPQPARAFVANAIRENKKYDLIVLDVYTGRTDIPQHLVTQEFFLDMRNILNDNGMVVANFVASASFSTPFSQKIDNSLRTVFPHITRQVLNVDNFWNNDPYSLSNMIYIYNHHKKIYLEPYSDNINRAYSDREKSVD